MRERRMVLLVAAGLFSMLSIAVAADEIVETTDGRTLRLRSDGIFEFLSRLDPKIMDHALATAREWAQDQTLVAYCLRNLTEGKMLAQSFDRDRDEALGRVRRAGATDQQLRQVVVTIAENFRAPMPGIEDKSLTETCAVQTVEQQVFSLSGPGLPIFLRPPFNQLK